MSMMSDRDFIEVTVLTVDQLRAVGSADAVVAEFAAIDWYQISAVVGKWPPQSPTAVTLPGRDWWRAESALAGAEATLSVGSDSQLLARVIDARVIIRDIATYVTRTGFAPDEIAWAESDDADDSDDDDADTSIVGPWPPEE